MQGPWYVKARRLATASVAGLVLAAGPLAAQTPPPGGGLTVPTVTPDESVRLFSSPRGEVYRLTQVEGEPQTGGGSLALAVARSGDAWQSLLNARAPEATVTVRDGDVAFGPSGETALVYRWWRHQPRSKQLRLARSDDGGKTWSQPSTQIDGSGTAFDPRVVWTRGKAVVVAWTDERRGRKLFDVYARRSPDGGTTWEPEQLLSRFPRNGPTDLYARPQIISDGGDRVWAVWVGLRGTKSFLYLTRSTDGGRTWTEPAPLSGESRSVFGHILLRAGDHLLLVWHDTPGERDRIFSATSADAGQTWTPPARVDHLAAGTPVAASSSAALLNADGEALVAWQDGRNGREDIFLARSTDFGRTWTGEDIRMDMDEPGTGFSRLPKLARAADGRIALAWEDDRAGHESVYVRVRSAGKAPQWGPEILVAGPAGKVAARVPDVAWGPGALFVAWQAWDNTLAPGRIDKRAAGRTLPIK